MAKSLLDLLEYLKDTTKARKSHDQGNFGNKAYLVFGKETAGLPYVIRFKVPERTGILGYDDKIMLVKVDFQVGLIQILLPQFNGNKTLINQLKLRNHLQVLKLEKEDLKVNYQGLGMDYNALIC